MAQSTVLTTKQGATLILPFQCSINGSATADFTGWKVAFMIRADFNTGAAAAVFNSGDLSVNPAGYVECVMPHGTSKNWTPGTYIAGARVYDPQGNYAYTDALSFIIQDAAYEDNF